MSAPASVLRENRAIVLARTYLYHQATVMRAFPNLKMPCHGFTGSRI
jgi:hypothetical protein